MSQQVTLSEAVEALALQVVMDELPAGPDFAQSLTGLANAVAGIANRAGAEGRQDVEHIASQLRETLQTSGGVPPPEVSRAVQEALTEMQQALETAGSPTPPEAAPPPAEYTLAQDPELLSDFVLESTEHLAAIESRSLAIELDPEDAEALNAIFRAFHTIKGLAGFLEMQAVREVSHEVETVLDLARNHKLSITSRVIDIVLESADYLKTCVANVAAVLEGQPPQAAPDSAPLLVRIRRLSDTDSSVVQEVAQPAEALAAAPAQVPAAPVRQSSTEPAKAVKVDTGKLDYLVDMAGELVIAQSLVRYDPALAALKNPRLQRNLAQLARITSELQKTSMSMRLVPIGQLFQRVSRQVRDLSRKVGKPAEMDISGEDTEIDRTIVEELGDPLMHMVRNALDHGIEDPAERAAAKKHPVARIGLSAYHQAGQIVIEISDDGRGLDRQRILAKAVKQSLVNNPEHLSDTEIFQLIFEPGFSTAVQVTDVSGRGVGMDVVRKHIQKLRGHIEIQSIAGQGATFTLKVPLTLAIIDGLVTGVGTERYIVPLFAVHEMFRPASGAISTIQNRGEMAMVRGTLLPIIRLHRRFGVKPRTEDPAQALLVVAESGGQRFCLMVDEMIGKQEAVIKSLGDRLRNIPGIAGGAILGDGRVALILDMAGLLKEQPRA
jgi:two-component system chemotaxis sensor kinase CheA